MCCREFRDEVKLQRAAMSVVIPVVPIFVMAKVGTSALVVKAAAVVAATTVIAGGAVAANEAGVFGGSKSAESTQMPSSSQTPATGGLVGLYSPRGTRVHKQQVVAGNLKARASPKAAPRANRQLPGRRRQSLHPQVRLRTRAVVAATTPQLAKGRSSGRSYLRSWVLRQSLALLDRPPQAEARPKAGPLNILRYFDGYLCAS